MYWITRATAAIFISYAFACGAQVQSNDVPPEPAMRAAKVDPALFTRGDALPSWSQSLRKADPTDRDGFIVRLANTQFWTGTNAEILIHRVMQSKSSATLSQIGQYSIQFIPAYQKVRLHFVRVERNGELLDRTQSTDVRFLEREPLLEQGIYAGTVTANLVLDDVRIGDSVSLAYTVVGRNPVLGTRFADSASWDRVEAIERRVVDVISPKQQKIQYRMLGEKSGGRVTPQITERENFRVMTFEERKLPAIEFEPAVPSDHVALRWLQLSEYETWGNVEEWANDLFAQKSTPNAELQSLIEKFKSLPNDSARASAAVRWVQQEIRYFSVSLGESSHRPHAPEEVLRRRYGDCKDKVFLLMHILNALGIESKPLLLSSQAPKMPKLMLPSPEAFDHVILSVMLSGKRFFVDPTRAVQQSPIENMTLTFPRASGLLIGGKTTDLMVLPMMKKEEATIEVEERIEATGFDKPARMTTRSVSRGFTAELVRFALANVPSENRNKLFTSQIEARYPKARLVGQPRVEDDVAKNQLSLSAEFVIDEIVVERNGDRAIRFVPEPFIGVISLPQTPKRIHPMLVTSVPLEAKYKLTVVWPENVSRTLDPSTTNVGGDFFSANIQRSFRGNIFTFEGTLSTKRDVAQPNEIASLRQDLKKLDDSIGYVSFVPSNSVNNSGFLGVGRRTLKDNIARRYEQEVDGASKTIKAAKLEGDDLAETFCARAIANAFLGNTKEAAADADEAVRVAPGRAEMHACRGNAKFAFGEFATAISDYTRALTLGFTTSDGYYRRGHVRFYAGQYDAALSDFEKASEGKLNSNGEAGTAHYAQLWQTWAAQRAGKPLSDALVTQAQREASGAWPRIALAMMVGERSPEQVISFVESQNGDEREMNLCEAHFYVGMYWLGKGRTDDAMASFQKSRDRGIIMYIEHMAAGHELARLKR